ncbi:MAG: symmetrical bis(5'-nucleosyl)-tetraphosphatase [Gammaproteobacteria bacterium]|nr:symmetrical bis(5'-nucleosyl)-tetraphosphatase [Gammaproteobacteria bacterium]
MAVYAIGDVQGCFDELLRLLDHIDFDPLADQVWLAGDLVNRGPRSADVLRLAMDLGPNRIKVVLGNHDLHLLANAAGIVEHQHHLDTMDSVLDAEDRAQLVYWLRHQPLFHHDPNLGFSMVHAGLPPEWTIEDALRLAQEVEVVLQSDNWADFFKHMYGNKPKRWSESLTCWDRLRFITNCFTRLRYCHDDGALALRFKGAPKDKPSDQKPWFDMPNRQSQQDKIVFGHWSTLGIGQYGNVFSLDSGAVWGETLTAVRIDQHPYQWFTIQAESKALPYGKKKQTPYVKRWL